MPIVLAGQRQEIPLGEDLSCEVVPKGTGQAQISFSGFAPPGFRVLLRHSPRDYAEHAHRANEPVSCWLGNQIRLTAQDPAALRELSARNFAVVASA